MGGPVTWAVMYGVLTGVCWALLDVATGLGGIGASPVTAGLLSGIGYLVGSIRHGD
jgi:hypothetical protein